MSASHINPSPILSKKVKTGSKQPNQKKMPHKVQKQNQQPIQSTLALLEKQLAMEIEIKSKLQHEKPQLTRDILEHDKETQEVIGRTMSALRIGTEGLSYMDSKPARVKKPAKYEGSSTPNLLQVEKKEKKNSKELKLMPCHLQKSKKNTTEFQKEEKKQPLTIQRTAGGPMTAYRKNMKKSQFKKESEIGGSSLSGRNIKQVEITLSEQGRQKKVVYSANCTPHNELVSQLKHEPEEYMSPTAKKHFKIKEAIRKDKQKKQNHMPLYQTLVSQSPKEASLPYYREQQEIKRSRQIQQEVLPRAFSDDQMGWTRRSQQEVRVPARDSVEKEQERLDNLLREMMKETQIKIDLFHREKEIELERTQRLSTVPVPDDEGTSAAPIRYQPNLVNRVIAERAENAFRNSSRRLVPSSASHIRESQRRSVMAEPEGELDSQPDSEPFS